MRNATLRRMVLAVAALSVVTTGCFGSFQMTRNLYTWNKGVGNKWTQELVYLVVGGLVPVYGLAGLIDAVVLNSIEFWTGKNPMTASTTKTFEQDGKRVVQTLRSDVRGRTEIVTISTASGPVSTVTRFQPAGSSVITSTTKYADGRVETKTVSATDEPVKY